MTYLKHICDEVELELISATLPFIVRVLDSQ